MCGDNADRHLVKLLQNDRMRIIRCKYTQKSHHVNVINTFLMNYYKISQAGNNDIKIITTFAETKQFNMKKFLFLTIAIITLTACHESLEDKAARQAYEFTKKNCPQQMSDGITIDSMTCPKGTRTIHYYYTISGTADTTAIDINKARAELLKAVIGDTGTRKYKENGFSFAYTYFSAKHKGQKLIDLIFTPKDYNNPIKGDK